MCNQIEGMLSVLAAMTIFGGWVYESDENTQSWLILVLISFQLLVVLVSVLLESFERSLFVRQYAKVVKNSRVLASERAKTLTRASHALQQLRDDISQTVGSSNKMSREILKYLLEKQQTPKSITDYDEVNAYERVQRLFSDGGHWRRIHTLAVSDPNSKMLELFIDKYTDYGVEIDHSCGALVKLVCVLCIVLSRIARYIVSVTQCWSIC